MDLQRRISRLLAIAGSALLACGVVAGALAGDAGAASQPPPDKPDHAGHTTTTEGPTTTTRKSKSSTTTTTKAPTTTTTAAATTTTGPTTTTAPPTTTTSVAPTTTTTGAAPHDQSAPAPSESPPAQTSAGQSDEAYATQVGPTTSTVNAPVSRGPKSPVVPPQNPPPAAPVTNTTASNPVPPAQVTNPLPRTPVTALSGPPPAPVSQEAVEGTPPVGPPVPPWDIAPPTPESEAARQAAGAAAPAPTRRSAQLGMTGSATRTLLFLAGISLLLGALAVALGEPGPLRAARATAGGPEGSKPRAKFKARTRRLRRTIQGWESGVPLAPTRRAAKRSRLERRGKLGISLPGGEPEA